MIVGGALEMTGTQFIRNYSAGAVGGLATGYASAHLTNVQFISNSALFEAGAFANLGVATITNSLFQFNQGVQSGAVRGGQLTLVDSRKETVTFEVRVAARRTHSRLTISKDQRIVHQVADEKNGEAYFATIRPWP